jgi:hypothetical protein
MAVAGQFNFLQSMYIEKLLVAQVAKMESSSTLPFSKQLVTEAHYKPDYFSPHPHIKMFSPKRKYH